MYHGASANLTLMIGVARKAARILLKDFMEVENLQISSKAAGHFVTKTDIAAQNLIQKELMQARPNYGWLGEESSHEIKGKDPTRRWIVDPLDGTTNFLHAIPHFAISIALEHKGEIVAGVIYDPIKNEIFYAEKNAGAYMNNTRLRVSDRKDIDTALFATGLPHGARAQPYLAQNLHDLRDFLPISAGARRMGAAALDLAYIAAGRFDGYWEYGLKAWDMAAGIIIVREAGGFVAPICKDEPLLSGTGIIATNTNIYEKFLGILQSSKDRNKIGSYV